MFLLRRNYAGAIHPAAAGFIAGIAKIETGKLGKNGNSSKAIPEK